ncbi:MAG: acyltransferase family protein [Sandaracinaceae bacterium]|nr:acyltransferase family protein [Sandaracinaceae bacterium]
MVRFAEEALGEELDARIARIRMHPNDAGVDPFGFDPATARYALALAAFLHRFYFRSEVFGTENIPEGRVLIIANHSGQIPIDGLMIGTSLMLDADPPRFPRSMVERWSADLPFISVLFPRCGQVVGSPDNARRLLENDEALLVFPEGSRGISKTFDRAYQLEAFGLGFLRLALETGTPIVPVAVVGGEEQLVSVANVKTLAKLLGMPAFPIIPQLFLGMPFPLPTRYRIHFGEPLRFDGDPDDDDAVIAEKVGEVTGAIERLLELGLSRRKAIFW